MTTTTPDLPCFLYNMIGSAQLLRYAVVHLQIPAPIILPW